MGQQAYDSKGDGQRHRIETVVRFLQCGAPEVPQAVAQLRAAGVEGLCGGVEVADEVRARAFGELSGGFDFHGDAGQGLGERVVQLDGEAGALLDLEVGGRLFDLTAEEFASAPLGERAQGLVPEEDGDERGEDESERDAEAARRPPRRAFEDDEVVRRPEDDEEAAAGGAGSRIQGSAIYKSRGQMEALNCRFIGNRIGLNGGGTVYVNEGVSKFDHCAFVANSALAGSAAGCVAAGALVFSPSKYAGTHEINNCTFAYNLSNANNAPAALYVGPETVRVRNSIFYGNIVPPTCTVGADIFCSDAAAGTTYGLDADYVFLAENTAQFVSCGTRGGAEPTDGRFDDRDGDAQRVQGSEARDLGAAVPRSPVRAGRDDGDGFPRDGSVLL